MLQLGITEAWSSNKAHVTDPYNILLYERASSRCYPFNFLWLCLRAIMASPCPSISEGVKQSGVDIWSNISGVVFNSRTFSPLLTLSVLNR